MSVPMYSLLLDKNNNNNNNKGLTSYSVTKNNTNGEGGQLAYHDRSHQMQNRKWKRINQERVIRKLPFHGKLSKVKGSWFNIICGTKRLNGSYIIKTKHGISMLVCQYNLEWGKRKREGERLAQVVRGEKKLKRISKTEIMRNNVNMRI